MEDALDSASQKPAFELAEAEEHQPLMVIFEQLDGSSAAFSYQDLRCVRYDPAGLVRLRFAADNVVLHGRNLLSIWRALRSRRVRLLRAGGAEMPTDHEPHIDTITITPAPRWE